MRADRRDKNVVSASGDVEKSKKEKKKKRSMDWDHAERTVEVPADIIHTYTYTGSPLRAAIVHMYVRLLT